MGNHHWVRHELNILRKGFQNTPDFLLVNSLTGRSRCALAFKRRRLGLKYSQEWINEQTRKFHLSDTEFC